MRILITGGQGYLGSWLTHHFSQKNYEVTVLSRSQNKLFPWPYELITSDITQPDDLDSKLTKSFDCCIHAASYNEYFAQDYHDTAVKINALGTKNLLDCLLSRGVGRFIYLSTFHVYGKSEGFINENSETIPINDYGLTHLFAEYYVKQACKTSELEGIIIRLSNGYGAPFDITTDKWYLVLNDLVKSAYENRKIRLHTNGGAIRDFIWLGDVCSAMEGLLHTEITACETFNLASEKVYTVFQLANKVKDCLSPTISEDLEIEINNEDATIYPTELRIDTTNLRTKINILLHEKWEHEIKKIFNMLDVSSEYKVHKLLNDCRV